MRQRHRVHQPVGEADGASEAVEAHARGERVEQLSPVDVRAVAHFEELVQGVRHREDRVVREGVVREEVLGVLRTREAAPGSLLAPQVRRVVVVALPRALAVRRQRQPRLPRQEGVELAGALPIKGVEGKGAIERALSLRRVVGPVRRIGGEGVVEEPEVPLAADPLGECLLEEGGAGRGGRDEEDGARARLAQRGEVGGARLNGDAHGEDEADGERRLPQRDARALAHLVERVDEREARVLEEVERHVDHAGGSHLHRRREAEEVRVALAIAQLGRDGDGRDDGHVGRGGDLRCAYRRGGAAGADDRADALPVEGVLREVERAGEARGVVALGVAVGEEQLRVGEQLVGDAVALVVDLAQRLVHAEQRRPRDGEVPRRRRAEGGEEHADAHGGDED
mmetsp:Transcript_22381/g.53765  ORF Transcript_22381/g.53765 Transcript_22381/m.53765 type:complete len:397 (+) Transcript_22381:3735-4925(+)